MKAQFKLDSTARAVLLIAHFACTVDVATADTSNTLPRVKVAGNRFELPDESTFVFRGLCLSDPDKLAETGHWNREYFAEAKRWGANVVRIPVHPEAWRKRGQKDYVHLLDQGILWATQLGLYVIIDWHSIGNLTTELFQHPRYETTRAETLQFWKTVSDRYQGNPVVACYELFNEPTRFNGKLGHMTWDDHEVLMKEMISTIRENDDEVIPLVGGFDWAYDLTAVRNNPIDVPGIAYVAHPYPQKREQPWEEKWENDFGFVSDKYPVFATEFGFMSENDPGAHIPVLGDETYGEAIIDYFEKNGISWTVWVFDPDWSPQLIADWQFTPTRQGNFFKPQLLHFNR